MKNCNSMFAYNNVNFILLLLILLLFFFTFLAASKVAVAGSNTDTSSTINKKCSICKELFMTIESHRNHLETVHADLLTCSICNKLFTLRASLRKHLKRHIQSFDGILLGTSVQLTTRTGELAIQPT